MIPSTGFGVNCNAKGTGRFPSIARHQLQNAIQRPTTLPWFRNNSHHRGFFRLLYDNRSFYPPRFVCHAGPSRTPIIVIIIIYFFAIRQFQMNPTKPSRLPFASSTFAFLIASYVRVASWYLVQPPASGLDLSLALNGVGPAAAGSTAIVAVRYVYAAVCAKSKQRNTSPDGRHCSQRRRQLFSVRASSTKGSTHASLFIWSTASKSEQILRQRMNVETKQRTHVSSILLCAVFCLTQ